MTLSKILGTSIAFLFFLSTHAQKVIVNTVGKDPYNAKATEIVYKAKEGEWTFQSFSNTVVKTTFRPADYARNEQVSDAVITKPAALTTKVTAAISPTIEWENLVGVVIQRDKLYYKMGPAVKVKSASYFVQGNNRGFRFQLSDNEQFFGGGERALPMNRRGYHLNLYNTPSYGYSLGADNLNFSVPFVISSAGYGIFFDNPSKGYIDIGLTERNILEAGFVSGELNYYIVFGKNLDEILKNYTAITGRQPLPPRWALGNFVSRFGYRSEEQIRKTADKMKQDNFPMDGLIIDLFWFGDDIKGTLGNLDWVNTAKWPNPKLMMEGLKATHQLKTVLITEPFILQGTRSFNEAQPFLATDLAGKPYMLPDLYFGTGGIVDIFRKQSQDWIWKYYKKQITNGATGWWVDLGEPEKHPDAIMHNLKDYGASRLLSADEVHNVFGHYWSKMLFEHYANDYPDIRLFNLNRAGFAGSQRYGVFPWTGDVARNWSGFKAQPLILLGMSLSGMPYIHSDAGGFAMTDQADPELYTRWLQFAAFTPIFRPHGTALEDYDKTIKSIPSEPCYWDEPYKSIVRNYINLRYQLLPYNYTLSYEQAVNGKPLMRPLYYYNFADSNSYKADDEYYWGDNLLVAPVTSQGATAKMLYLPAGKWYSLTTNAVTEGGKFINENVTLKQIPVYVKEGSFVPMWFTKDTIRSTEQYDTKEMTVRYYPSTQSSSYAWYDDDGFTNKTLEKADYEVVTFKGITTGNKISIDITTNNPNNYGKRSKRKFLIEVPGGVTPDALVNGKAVTPESVGKHNDPFQQTTNQFISVEFAGKPVNVQMTIK